MLSECTPLVGAGAGTRASYASVASTVTSASSSSTSVSTSIPSSRRRGHKIKPLKYCESHLLYSAPHIGPSSTGDIRRATKSAYAALRHDTAACYFKVSPSFSLTPDPSLEPASTPTPQDADDPLAYDVRETVGLAINYGDAILRGKALTIGHGASTII